MIAPTPNPKNLYLGAGEVWLDRFNPITLLPTGQFRHLGNVDSLEINTAVKALEKKSSMSGVRSTYANVIVEGDAEVTIKLSELDPENMALSQLGETADWTQDTVAAFTARAIPGIDTVLVLDRWYDLGAINPEVTAVKQDADTLVAGVDYIVDLVTGLIKFPSTGAADIATPATWDGVIPALTGGKEWFGLSQPETYGALRYRSARDQVTGLRMILDIWNIQLMPDGNLQLIAETWGEATLKGKIQLDVTKPFGQQYYRTRQLPDSAFVVA